MSGHQKNFYDDQKSRTAMCLTNGQKDDSFFCPFVKPDTDRTIQELHEFFCLCLDQSYLFILLHGKLDKMLCCPP